jgi:hypothetical protein
MALFISCVVNPTSNPAVAKLSVVDPATVVEDVVSVGETFKLAEFVSAKSV